MSDDRETLAKVLAEHGEGGRVNSRDQTIACACGEWLHVGPFADVSSGYPDPEVEERVKTNHVADAILASQWLADRDARRDAATGERIAADALQDAAHEIRHSVSPMHPNSGYRDGHEHAAWVVESLIGSTTAPAQTAGTCQRIEEELPGEGPSCWVHNESWDECPHRRAAQQDNAARIARTQTGDTAR